MKKAGRVETSFQTCRDVAAQEARHEIGTMKDAGLALGAVTPAEAEDVHLACELATFCEGLDDEDRLEAVLVSLRGGPREAMMAALMLSGALFGDADGEGRGLARRAALALEEHRARQTTLAARLAATRLLATFRLNNGQPEEAAGHVREAAMGGDLESRAILAMMTCCEHRGRDEALAAVVAIESLAQPRQPRDDGAGGADDFDAAETAAIVEGVVAAVVFHSPLVDEPVWRDRMLAAIAASDARTVLEDRQAAMGPEMAAMHLAFAGELGFGDG